MTVVVKTAAVALLPREANERLLRQLDFVVILSELMYIRNMAEMA